MIRYFKRAIEKTKNMCRYIWSIFTNIKEIVILNVTHCLYNNICDKSCRFLYIYRKFNIQRTDTICKNMYIKRGKWGSCNSGKKKLRTDLQFAQLQMQVLNHVCTSSAIIE